MLQLTFYHLCLDYVCKYGTVLYFSKMHLFTKMEHKRKQTNKRTKNGHLIMSGTHNTEFKSGSSIYLSPPPPNSSTSPVTPRLVRPLPRLLNLILWPPARLSRFLPIKTINYPRWFPCPAAAHRTTAEPAPCSAQTKHEILSAKLRNQHYKALNLRNISNLWQLLLDSLTDII